MRAANADSTTGKAGAIMIHGILGTRRKARGTKKLALGFSLVVLAFALPVAGVGAEADKPNDKNAGQARLDLEGHILARGKPVPDATVFIYTAGPKIGTSTFCPSCYADCRKSAKTDAEGKFKIESLDPRLIFRILAVAKGFAPKFESKVDPDEGPVYVTLRAVDLKDVTPDRSLRGQVVDSDGKPVFGAVVASHGVRRKDDSGTMWGQLPGVDPLAVTDESGEFLLTALDPFVSLDVRVEARTFANKTFSNLPSGTAHHTLKMTEGVTVKGRVLSQRKPLAGVSVGMVSVDRGVENFTGNFEIGTDSDGQFAFMNLPANVDYQIYGLMNTLRTNGTIPIRNVHAGADGTTVDAGDLLVEPACRLAGRVECSDGHRLPMATRLLISREQAWDSIQVEVGEDGTFDIQGIPKETISLSARVGGYHISPKNPSLDPLNDRLVGRVEQDVTNLVFLLDKGPEPARQFNPQMSEEEWPQNQRLRGAESAPDHSHQWLAAGMVRDSQTKAPIANFWVTPGNSQSQFNQTSWDERNKTGGTNGSFSVYVNKRFNEPVLKVEAEGYVPARLRLQPESRTNLDIALQKGTGPRGVVLLPDGKTAADVSVALLCAGDQSLSLNAKGELRSWQRQDALQFTDEKGAFELTPELDMLEIAVAAKEGFRLILVDQLATNSNIALEPWGKLKGVLHRGDHLGTNEDVDLAFQGQHALNLQLHSTTDDQGRFEFERVPPGPLQINGRIMVQANSWMWDPLEKVTLKPGQDMDVDIHAPAKSQQPAVLNRAAPIAKITLKSGPGPTGTLLLPNGKPAADAEVALLVTGKYTALGKGSLKAYEARQEGLVIRAGSDGHFTLPNVEGATGLLAVHDDGFGFVPLEKLTRSPQVQLEAWGRIEGVLHVGQRLGTNEVVVLESGNNFADATQLMLDVQDFQARTDEQGRFIMTFVPPGERRIARLIPVGAGRQQHSAATTVVVNPGTVTKVEVGGTGRTVVGKIHVPDQEVNWQNVYATLHTQFPEGFKKQRDPEEQKKWFSSPEAKAAMKAYRVYPLVVSADGAFSAEEVLHGNYIFDVTVMSASRPQVGPPDSIGHFQQSVVVQEPAGKNDPTPADLGTVESKLEAVKQATAGK